MASDLPFGLRHYSEGEFDQLHACGSKQVTASLVPSLLNESPFFGRFAAMAHVLGRAPLKIDKENRFLLRGHELEPLVSQKVAKAEDWEVRHLQAVVDHPTIGGFKASPDALAWTNGKEGPGVGELKVVSKWAYNLFWQDGPPSWVHLQNQAQLTCTPEAKWGFIAAFVIETWDVLVWDTKPVVREFISQQVGDDLAMISRDELPPMEPSPSTYAAICAMFGAPEGEVVIQDPESMGMMLRWLRAQEQNRTAAKDLEDCRNYFAALAPEARRIKVPPIGVITAAQINRKAYAVEEAQYRSMRARAWRPGKDGEHDDEDNQP